ncbi:MAG: hypoxanthine phosphoribosyltransferase [Clostridia bacterium]|nr:hypoxanthine phosphoribosyltransferase [Clostridia bacterium]
MRWTDSVEKILVTEEQIKARIAELGAQITKDYEGKKLIVVGILKGAIVFYSDLARHIDMPMTFDFLSVSSYGNSTVSSGEIKFMKDLDQPVEGYDILIVEDIVDSGRTLSYLRKNLEARNPNSVRVCCLLDKKERREVEVEVNYVGFDIPDEFVVGYGLDFAGMYRNLPYIGVLAPSAYEV